LNTLRRKPIFIDTRGRAIVIDPVFLAEKACVGPVFHVRENRVFDAFGLAVERYGQGILRIMYPSVGSGLLYDRLRCPLRGNDQKGREVQLADAFLGGNSEAVFFEIKGRWLKEEVLAAAPEDYQKQLRDKYSGKTGVGQIVRNILTLTNGQSRTEGEELAGVERIFPVLVAYEYRLDAPLHPRFLAQDFARGLSGDDTIREIRVGAWSVAPLTVMTIDDFRNLGIFGSRI
jgi:hypothetical protein